MRGNYELGNTVLATMEPYTLWKNDQGLVEIEKDTLAIPVTLNNEMQGYIFGGKGKMILDAIVETEEGAIGKSIEKSITEPFVALGNTENFPAQPAIQDNREFTEKARNLFGRLFNRGRVFGDICSHSHREEKIFAFENPENSELDMLIVKDSKIVYEASGVTFISSDHNTVMKDPVHMVVSHNGRSLILRARH